MCLIGRGTTGTVYRLNTLIAVKRARVGEEEQTDHAHEQGIFDILESYPQLPYLIRSYYRRPLDTFLELAPNGNIAILLNQFQQRNREGTQVMKVWQALDTQHVFRWVRQLCCAAASLERIGLCHGDIRPGNMLLDADWNLRLCDFDRTVKIGEHLTVLTEPFGRLLDENDDGDAGTYGKATAQVDAFAIGSVYYTLLNGHEPYETEAWGKDHFVILCEKFQKKELPQLTHSSEHDIIHKCWNGAYRHISDISKQFTSGESKDAFTVKGQDCLEMRKRECEAFCRSGRIDTLDRY
ncbi:MAG: hypothetical protein Q9167_006616 [Letrouitia subvulpina]